MPDMQCGEALTLQVRDLSISYETRRGNVPAVRGVSFDIHRQETYGLVGESGCGKSTVAFSLVGFLGRNGKIDAGSIMFEGNELRGRSEKKLRQLRGDRIAMVYQDPMRALNPSLRIGQQLSEVLVVHRQQSKDQAYEQCVDMLKRVYMPDPDLIMERYPHQLSGGQQQRVLVAMALLNNPSLLIMDEPTTALDVTVEAAVLDLIYELRQEFNTAILYITHNLGVIGRIADRAGVMYAGEIVEEASTADILLNPTHPYTQGLMRCVPRLGLTKESSYLHPIPGSVPSPTALPPGCIFEPRCHRAQPECRQSHPEIDELRPGHRSRCFFAREILEEEAIAGEGLPEELHAHGASGPGISEPILELRHVQTYYEQESDSLASLVGLGKKRYIKAVEDVSLEAPKGYTVGIVGESGCGKSTLAKTIVGLERLTGGRLQFLSQDISKPLSDRSLDTIRELQMVFQNPDSTMNPAFSIGTQIGRPLHRFKVVPRQKVREEVIRLLEAVKLSATHYDRLPGQLSGGEKQRVGIARAFAARPELVVCDEPVSALDVSVQAAVLNLLLDIQRQHDTTLVFIAHDLSTVHFFCDYIAVMYLGRLVEIGPAEALYTPPYHPYTEALLSAVPIPDPRADQKRIRLSGNVPSALNAPGGCPFHTRCPRRHMLPDGGQVCESQLPGWSENSADHRILCHIPLEELRKVKPVLTVGSGKQPASSEDTMT
jgi:peptide/nickel transport system ATP-binding protein